MLRSGGGDVTRITTTESRAIVPSPRAARSCKYRAFACRSQVESSDARVCEPNCGALGGTKRAELQMEGMWMGVKVKKPDKYDGDKSRDLDTWLF